MENKEMKQIFNSIDKIVGEVYSARIDPKFSEEIEKRNQRNPTTIQDDNDVLRRFARLIAFSQNAPSDKVSDMLDKGIFDDIFHNFEVDEVAKMNPEFIIDHYWDKIRVIRFKKKIHFIVDCANSLILIERECGSFAALLKDIPVSLKSRNDVEIFWEKFNVLKNNLEKVNMPFFRQSTSLLHFLLHIGYDCIKPDVIIMEVAKNLGIVSSNSEKDRLQVVKFIQLYSISRRIRPSIVDFYLLIYGGQRWAKKFVHASFYEGK